MKIKHKNFSRLTGQKFQFLPSGMAKRSNILKEFGMTMNQEYKWVNMWFCSSYDEYVHMSLDDVEDCEEFDEDYTDDNEQLSAVAPKPPTCH